MSLNFLYGAGLTLVILLSSVFTPALTPFCLHKSAFAQSPEPNETVLRLTLSQQDESVEFYYVEANARDTRKIGRIKSFFQKQVKKDRETNPKSETIAITSAPQGDTEADEIAQQLKADSQLNHAYSPAKTGSTSLRYRMVFTALRFIGVFSSVYFINKTNEPNSVQLATAITSGLLSAILQFKNKDLQDYLQAKGSGYSFWKRWYLTEVAYLSMVNLAQLATASFTTGIFSDLSHLPRTLWNIATASFWGLLSQGFADKLNIHYRDRKKARTPASQHTRIQLWSDLRTLVVSAFSVAVAVAKLNGLPLADQANWILGGLGAIGLLWMKSREGEKPGGNGNLCIKDLGG